MLKRFLCLALVFSGLLRADIYELRTYTTHEGKMSNLLERFENHTLAIFESHGIANIGYWLTEATAEEPAKLVYLVAHKNAEAAAESWAAFRADEKWQAAYRASIADGKIVKAITSEYLTPTEFSKLR